MRTVIGNLRLDRRAVVIDIDGVLADFSLAFTQLLVEAGKLDRAVPGMEQKAWRFRDSLPITRKDEDAAWRHIDASATFWAGLPSLLTPQDTLSLLYLSRLVRLVYMTGRREAGNNVVAQTLAWLGRHNLPGGEVILEPDKAKGVAALGDGIIGIIDDKPAALEALRDLGMPVTAMDMVYNRHVTGVPRVASVGEWAREMLGRHETNAL